MPATVAAPVLVSHSAEIDEKAALLAQVPLFSGMPEACLAPLGKALQERSWPSGALICRLGDAGDRMFIVRSGEVAVSVPGTHGSEVVLAKFGPADFFGDMALLDGQPRSANVRACTEAVLLELARDDFLDFFSAHRRALENLLLALSLRLRDSNRLIQRAARGEPIRR